MGVTRSRRNTLALLAPVCGCGVTATASADATPATDGALIAPFGPVSIPLVAVVSQTAPFAGAFGRQAERVDAVQIVDFTIIPAHYSGTVAPGFRDFAMQIVGVWLY